MIKSFWHIVVVFFYIRSGIRYGIDQETSLYTGDDPTRIYGKIFNIWSKLYYNLGYKLIDDEIWYSCVYDQQAFEKYLKICRF